MFPLCGKKKYLPKANWLQLQIQQSTFLTFPWISVIGQQTTILSSKCKAQATHHLGNMEELGIGGVAVRQPLFFQYHLCSHIDVFNWS